MQSLSCAKRAFSVKPCINTYYPNNDVRLHENSNKHQRLENKITEASRESALYKFIIVAQKKSFNTIHTNNLHLRKCIHTLFFMVKKRMTLTYNYGDATKFIAEKIDNTITLQYLQTCPRNATYVSNTSSKSLLDANNRYYETRQLKEKAPFFLLQQMKQKTFPKKTVSQYLLLITLYLKTVS